MNQQQQNSANGVPETVRVRVQRGFRGFIDGRFGIANPGDVVEIPRDLAFQMRAAGKAYAVTEDLKRQANYLPERKRPEQRVSGSTKSKD